MQLGPRPHRPLWQTASACRFLVRAGCAALIFHLATVEAHGRMFGFCSSIIKIM